MEGRWRRPIGQLLVARSTVVPRLAGPVTEKTCKEITRLERKLTASDEEMDVLEVRKLRV